MQAQRQSQQACKAYSIPNILWLISLGYIVPEKLLQVCKRNIYGSNIGSLETGLVLNFNRNPQLQLPFLQFGNMTTPLEVAKDLFCGCMSGWGQVVSMLPFENIKIKVISKPEEYNQGYIHAIKKTISQEGPMSLYKGMLFPLIGVGAQVSVQFGFVETLKKIMKKSYADENGLLHWRYSFLSGLICGLPSAIIVTPLDHSRFKVTLNKEKGQGSVKMATRIFQQHGLRKLYLGFYPTLIRQSIGLGCYFGFYDALIKHFTHDGKVNLLGALLSGAVAGIGFWSFIYPVDYIKTIVQADSLTAPKFKGSWHCATEQLKKGHKVFFTGFGIMMWRAMVANAVGFACFQMGKKIVY